MTLWANDEQIGEGRLDKTVPIAFTSYAGIDIGRDNGGVVNLGTCGEGTVRLHRQGARRRLDPQAGACGGGAELLAAHDGQCLSGRRRRLIPPEARSSMEILLNVQGDKEMDPKHKDVTKLVNQAKSRRCWCGGGRAGVSYDDEQAHPAHARRPVLSEPAEQGDRPPDLAGICGILGRGRTALPPLRPTRCCESFMPTRSLISWWS